MPAPEVSLPPCGGISSSADSSYSAKGSAYEDPEEEDAAAGFFFLLREPGNRRRWVSYSRRREASERVK